MEEYDPLWLRSKGAAEPGKEEEEKDQKQEDSEWPLFRSICLHFNQTLNFLVFRSIEKCLENCWI